jgi:hypothetical protein
VIVLFLPSYVLALQPRGNNEIPYSSSQLPLKRCKSGVTQDDPARRHISVTMYRSDVLGMRMRTPQPLTRPMSRATIVPTAVYAPTAPTVGAPKSSSSSKIKIGVNGLVFRTVFRCLFACKRLDLILSTPFDASSRCRLWAYRSPRVSHRE